MMRLIVLGLLCSTGCAPATTKPAEISAMKSTKNATENQQMKWECFYIDGSNNEFYFYRNDGKIHFRYDPIQPMMSSSGVYSGGTAKEGVLTPEQAQTLESQLKYWSETTGAHVERRIKGVGSFRMVDGDTERLFLIPESQLKELNVLLKPLRP